MLGQRRQHRTRRVARARVEDRERLAALGGEGQEALPAVVRRAPRPDEAAALEALQQPAEIAEVEAEVPAQGARGGLPALRQVVQQACLGERVRAAEQALAQYADAPCVESAEATHRLDVHAAILSNYLLLSSIYVRARGKSGAGHRRQRRHRPGHGEG